MKKLRFIERAFLIELLKLSTNNTTSLSLRAIGKQLGVSHQTANNFFHKFSEMGLVEVQKRNRGGFYIFNINRINKLINDSK